MFSSPLSHLAGLLALAGLLVGCHSHSSDSRFESDSVVITVPGGAGAGSSLAEGFEWDAQFPQIDTSSSGDNVLDDAELCCITLRAVGGQDLSFIDRVEVEAEDQRLGGGREGIAKFVGRIPDGVRSLRLDITERHITEFVDTDDEEIELKVKIFGIVPDDDAAIEVEIQVDFELIDID